MKLNLIGIACLAMLCACSNPKDTVVPTSLDKLETIKPQLEKLSAEERELFGAYMLRHTVGAAMGGLFGIKSEPIPEGMTIGKAIDEQRDFKAQAAIREAEAKALKEKVLAEQAKAVEEMRKAAVVTLVSKKIVAERSYGVTISENLIVTFAFKNTAPKDIAGIKGTVDAIDIFGEELSGFNLSYDTTIRAGETATWVGSRSVHFGRNEANDRKFAGLPEDKYTITWKPEMIVFADGTKLTKPADVR